MTALFTREETPADRERIGEVVRLAFGREDEAALVDRLREDGEPIASLVAVSRDRVAGHVLFSSLPCDAGDRVIRGAALAPLAVRPDCQGQGIGSALVREGLTLCRDRGIAIVTVLGCPLYYERFGFSSRTASHLRAPFSGDAFMALELTPGTLRGTVAAVRYPPAFGLAGGKPS